MEMVGESSDLDISTIVCAYSDERWQDLTAAIRSLQMQSTLPTEIIVVIDHNPRLLDRVRNELPGVIAIENEEERGLSGARNTGVRRSRSPIIAFLDDDATADQHWLAFLAAAYSDLRVMGTGGSIEPVWVEGRPRWFPDEFDWVVGCTYRGLPSEPATLRNLIGANMSFRREVFDAVGGFRTGVGRIGVLPMGCEETELCIRAGNRWPNQVFLYEPAARVYHRVPPARGRWRYFRSRSYAEGLSKAQIAAMVGAVDGLSTEWKYALWTLPSGILRNLRQAIVRRDLAAAGRAAAIIAGFTMTTIGYLTGRFGRRLTAARSV
ncbi:MAG TPA: glycosyltransferase family 2 protein [Anaerolineae bacterium]